MELHCSQCGRAFAVADKEAGHRVRCPHCGGEVAVAAPGRRFWPEGRFERLHRKPEPGDKPGPDRPAMPIELETPEPERENPPGAVADYDPIYEAQQMREARRAAWQGFRRDLVRLIPPVRTRGELPEFLVMVVVLAVWPYTMFFNICCVVGAVRLGLMGLLISFFYSIVADTAEGVDELGYVGSLAEALTHPWSEIVVPLVNFVVAVIYTQIPAALVLGVLHVVLEQPPMEVGWAVASVVGVSIAGALLWPMVTLVLAFDRIEVVVRPDLIVASIIESRGAYGLGCLVLGGAIGLYAVVEHFIPGPERMGDMFRWGSLVAGTLLKTLDLAVFIYGMRVVGLIGRHYGACFPWRMEQREWQRPEPL